MSNALVSHFKEWPFAATGGLDYLVALSSSPKVPLSTQHVRRPVTRETKLTEKKTRETTRRNPSRLRVALIRVQIKMEHIF